MDEKVPLLRPEEGKGATAKSKGSFGGTIFTVINSIVGGGVVALPFVLKSAGLALGNVLIVLFGIIILASVKIMIATSIYTFGEGRSYDALAQKAFGPRLGKALLEFTIDIYVLGTITGYVNIIGATLAPLINSISPSFCLEEKWIQIIVAGCLLFPLSSLKSMAMFRFTGFAAFLCIMFVMISIIIGGARTIITEGANLTNNIVWADFSFNSIFNALPVVAFAYVFHASFFPIWDSMEDGSNKKITAATSLALGFVAIVYMAIGSFGYLSFGAHTDSNIMENYPASDILMVVAKVGYLLVVCAAYPINCFVLRSSLDKLIFPSSQPAPWWRNFLIALVLVSLSTVLAIVLPTISLILGIVGSVPGSFLAFVFPALFYIILVDNSSPSNTESYMSLNAEGVTVPKKSCGYYFTWQKLFMWALLLLGLAFCAISMVAIIGSAMNPVPQPPTPGLTCPVTYPNVTAPSAAPVSMAPAVIPAPNSDNSPHTL